MKGEYQHSIDGKNRLFIPARLREELGDSFTLTRGLDGCLYVYSKDNWDVLEQKIKALPMTKSRDFQRYFFSGASECEPDAQGRVVIPQPLREHAGLSREVTVIGVGDRAEIWDADKWREYSGSITSDGLAIEMESLGF